MASSAGTGAVAYLDSSAIVKLVRAEPETASLRAEVARWPYHASSRLAEIEVSRAALSLGHTSGLRARNVLAAMSLLDIDRRIIATAGTLPPAPLRTLDAIHVASALELGADLGVLISYDARMLTAARMQGMPLLAPGADLERR